MNLLYRIDEWIDLKQARKYLFIAALTPLALIPLDFLRMAFQKSQTSRVPDRSIHQQEKHVDPISSFQSAFEKSEVFGNVLNSPSAINRIPIAELVKDFRLKGVVIMGDPEAVIEDARTQKTTFVRKGERVGDLVIKEIKEGSIVLISGSDEVQMEIQ